MGQTPCEASQTCALCPPSSTGRALSLHVHYPGLQGQLCLLTWDMGTGHLTPYLTLPHPPPRAELSDQCKDARISLTCHHQTPRWSEGGRRRGARGMPAASASQAFFLPRDTRSAANPHPHVPLGFLLPAAPQEHQLRAGPPPVYPPSTPPGRALAPRRRWIKSCCSEVSGMGHPDTRGSWGGRGGLREAKARPSVCVAGGGG